MNIPFFPNTGDGTHCFQAALRMALAALMPEHAFTMKELDRLSQKLPGKWTWPTAALLWLVENGFTVELVEDFDYMEFAEKGGDYLIRRFGEEVGRAQIEHSDIERERGLARRISGMGLLSCRIPGLSDLRSRVESGAVVIANINAAALNSQPGYSGHFVVLCEVGDVWIRLHDPGLPPRPDLEVLLERFNAAWAYPSDRDKNILALRRPYDHGSLYK